MLATNESAFKLTSVHSWRCFPLLSQLRCWQLHALHMYQDSETCTAFTQYLLLRCMHYGTLSCGTHWTTLRARPCSCSYQPGTRLANSALTGNNVNAHQHCHLQCLHGCGCTKHCVCALRCLLVVNTALCSLNFTTDSVLKTVRSRGLATLPIQQQQTRSSAVIESYMPLA